jgi:hypothetical protein
MNPSTRKDDTLGLDNGGGSVQPYRALSTPFELSAPRPIHVCRLRAGFQHKARLSGARSGATTPDHCRCESCFVAANIHQDVRFVKYVFVMRVTIDHISVLWSCSLWWRLHLAGRSELKYNASYSEREVTKMQTVDYQQALLDAVEDLPAETIPNLLQIVHLYKESVLGQGQKAVLELQAEFKEWDRLSDEALLEFEKGL